MPPVQAPFDYQLRYRCLHISAKFTNFEVANKEGLMVTKINNALMIYAGIFHSGGPVAIMLYHYVRGTMSADLIVHPFKGVYAMRICFERKFDLSKT